MDLWDIIGGGLNIAGGIAGYKAAKEAGKTQSRAAEQAAAGFRPYADLGDYAAGQLKGQLNKNALLRDFTFTGKDFKTDPGYQFRLSEGNKAIDRAAGARGGRYSGATLKNLQRFSQDLASNEYGNAYNRAFTQDQSNRINRYNFLAGPTQIGQGATGQVGNYVTNAGDARAAGQIGAMSNLWGGLADAYGTANPNRVMNNHYMYLLPSGMR